MQVGRVVAAIGLSCLVAGMLFLGPKSDPNVIAYIPFAGGAVVCLAGLLVEGWGREAQSESHVSGSAMTLAGEETRAWSRPELCWVIGVVVSFIGLAGCAAGTWGAALLQSASPYWPVLAGAIGTALVGIALQAAAGVALLVTRRAIDPKAAARTSMVQLVIVVALIYSHR